MDTSLFDIFYKSSGISTDTRSIEKNALFICIKGANFDGNTFAKKALEQGALHVIVDDLKYFIDNGQMTLVNNSLLYLQGLANFHRRKFDIPVIGVTGSNGKTTSKELIHQVLSKKYAVLATIGNLNNHLGVPFTLLRLTDKHEIAIIEMGANRFKDIEELCTIAEPTHAIITNIGKAHLEGFVNFEGVLKTKKELYDAVAKRNGKIIVNSDDSVLMNILPENIEWSSYGTNKTANVWGELVSLSPYVEMKWKSTDYDSPPLSTQMIGKYNFYNYLAAVAFGIEFNVENKDISNAIEEYSPTNKRSQVEQTDRNTLILDCYNANPTSMESALESFAMNNHPNKLFILGDMKELGHESNMEHQAILQLVEELNLNGYVVGEEFSAITSNSIRKKFKNAEELKTYLNQHEISDHLILLKGSRSIGLEILENSL